MATIKYSGKPKTDWKHVKASFNPKLNSHGVMPKKHSLPDEVGIVKFVHKNEAGAEVTDVLWEQPIIVNIKFGSDNDSEIQDIKSEWGTFASRPMSPTIYVGNKQATYKFTNNLYCYNITLPQGLIWSNSTLTATVTSDGEQYGTVSHSFLSSTVPITYNAVAMHYIKNYYDDAPSTTTKNTIAKTFTIDFSSYITKVCTEFRVVVYDRCYYGTLIGVTTNDTFNYDKDGVLYNQPRDSLASIMCKTKCLFQPQNLSLTTVPQKGLYPEEVDFSTTVKLDTATKKQFDIRKGGLFRHKLSTMINCEPNGSHDLRKVILEYRDGSNGPIGSASIDNNNWHYYYFSKNIYIRPTAYVTDDRLYYVAYKDNNSYKYTTSGTAFSQGFQTLSTSNYCNSGNTSTGEFYLQNIDTELYDYVEMTYVRANTWKAINHMHIPVTLGYNQKLCNEPDAKNWTNLADKTSITLGAGKEHELPIANNWWANTAVCSYISGSANGKYRWISYMINGDTSDRNNRISA